MNNGEAPLPPPDRLRDAGVLRVREMLGKGGPPVADVMASMLEEGFPGLLGRFYPRHYINVGQYHSPKHCAVYMASMLTAAYGLGYDGISLSSRAVLPSLQPLIDKRMPLFFIAPDLLKAVMLTTFDGDVDWVSLKLPYEHGIFVLPRGAYRHPEKGEVSMILWSRLLDGAAYPLPIIIPIRPVGRGLPRRIVVSDTSFILSCYCPEGAMWYSAHLVRRKTPTLRLGDLFHCDASVGMPCLRPESELDLPTSEQDGKFLQGIGIIAVGTIMAMNARPELLEHARLDHVVKANKDRPRKEFWTPNIIGSKYRLPHEAPSEFHASAGQGGTHASPRMHWRRGHFTHQPCGPQRQLRKVIWLEPMLVAADAEEETEAKNGKD